jgi:hypothetical protein
MWIDHDELFRLYREYVESLDDSEYFESFETLRKRASEEIDIFLAWLRKYEKV